MTRESQLEALLFWKGEPISKKKIEAYLACTAEELEVALTNLETILSTRGIRLMRIDDEVELRTAPETSDMIVKLTKEELIRDLGKAGLETLSIILYKAPIKRSEIDYIRGVNSSFIIRNLLIRGLIDRVTEKEGAGRGFAYKPTIDLLAHLGIAKIEDLPEYVKVKSELESFETP
ncbi:MAG: segregation and condensation protein segregation and condensation protein [Candidatus Parcubacteria bacterium]|jgi:segregation and condensation protein B